VCEEAVDAHLVVVRPRRLQQQVIDDVQAARPEQRQQLWRPLEHAGPALDIREIEPGPAAPFPQEVTGVLMAAAMGMDTVAWRDQFGRIPPKEALVHNFVLWLLADLHDSLVEQPGATDQLMRETFNSMATESG
jgi:hypothetical protein